MEAATRGASVGMASATTGPILGMISGEGRSALDLLLRVKSFRGVTGTKCGVRVVVRFIIWGVKNEAIYSDIHPRQRGHGSQIAQMLTNKSFSLAIMLSSNSLLELDDDPLY